MREIEKIRSKMFRPGPGKLLTGILAKITGQGGQNSSDLPLNETYCQQSAMQQENACNDLTRENEKIEPIRNIEDIQRIEILTGRKEN